MTLEIKTDKPVIDIIELRESLGIVVIDINGDPSARYYQSGAVEVYCEEKQEWFSGKWKK